MNLPKASELDAWLTGYAEGFDAGQDICNDPAGQALSALHRGTLRWLRTHNDRAALDCPELPELERRYGAARTTDAKRDALRGLLAARDKVVANMGHHDAVQDLATLPLALGTHPLGFKETT
jgi:hypothetical protein